MQTFKRLKSMSMSCPVNWFQPTGNGGIPSEGAQTVAQQFVLPKYSGVRVRLHNYGTEPLVVNFAKFAPVNTSGSNGANLAYQSLKVSGNTTFSIPASVGTTFNIIPGFVDCDDLFISSVDRIDGGVFTLGMLRVSYGGTPTLHNAEIGKHRTFANQFRGILQASGQGVSDIADSVGINLDVADDWYFWSAGEITALCDEPVISLMVHGDSIMNAIDSWVPRTMMSANLGGIDLVICNLSKGGSSKALSTYPRFLAELKATPNFRPTLYGWSPYSVNDGFDAASINLGWRYTVYVMDWCLKNGVVPLIHTPMPNNTLDLQADLDAFDDVREKVLNLRNFGAIVPDFGLAISDPSNHYHFASGTNEDDTHPNSAGHEILALTCWGEIKWALKL
jgi:hypothetical protein